MQVLLLCLAVLALRGAESRPGEDSKGSAISQTGALTEGAKAEKQQLLQNLIAITQQLQQKDQDLKQKPSTESNGNQATTTPGVSTAKTQKPSTGSNGNQATTPAGGSRPETQKLLQELMANMQQLRQEVQDLKQEPSTESNVPQAPPRGSDDLIKAADQLGGGQPGGSRVESQNPATGSNFSPSKGQLGDSRAESQNPATGSNFSPPAGQPGGSRAESQNLDTESNLSPAAGQPGGLRAESQNPATGSNFSPAVDQPKYSRFEPQRPPTGSDLSQAADQPEYSRFEPQRPPKGSDLSQAADQTGGSSSELQIPLTRFYLGHKADQPRGSRAKARYMYPFTGSDIAQTANQPGGSRAQSQNSFTAYQLGGSRPENTDGPATIDNNENGMENSNADIIEGDHSLAEVDIIATEILPVYGDEINSDDNLQPSDKDNAKNPQIIVDSQTGPTGNYTQAGSVDGNKIQQNDDNLQSSDKDNAIYPFTNGDFQIGLTGNNAQTGWSDEDKVQQNFNSGIGGYAASQVRDGGDIYGDVPSSGRIFGYILIAVVLCTLGYVIYYNKQKVR
ncbi:hypothetical protein PoB_002482300 [Plakobranchus ocellatus]|uniref:Uncharacterized protein n=1 Tax=Plakobranchus ocellatus TaxID=259542 RepID=A0AAV3ZV61_9GAST|nr:hypothetical protein PoB_002482300 [Plakobranchus ocellatus]